MRNLDALTATKLPTFLIEQKANPLCPGDRKTEQALSIERKARKVSVGISSISESDGVYADHNAGNDREPLKRQQSIAIGPQSEYSSNRPF